MIQPYKLKGTKGAIFIDVMLGIYIIAVAGLVYAATLGAAVVSRGKADQHTKAAAIVQRQLESLKAVGYGNLNYNSLVHYDLIDTSSNSSPYSFTNAENSSKSVSDILPNGRGTITITDLPPKLSNMESTLRRVDVTVTWDSRTGTQTVTASTTIAKLK
ncbi:MAG: hypothetical protein SNJ70_07060 [Armatimonadota bacterium]